MKPWQERLARAYNRDDEADGVEVVDSRCEFMPAGGHPFDIRSFRVESEFTTEDVPALLPLVGSVNVRPIGDIPAGSVRFAGMTTDRGGPSAYRFDVRNPVGRDVTLSPDGWQEFKDIRGETLHPSADLDQLP